MSTGFPYGSFLNTSGDRYPGVPAKPAETKTFNVKFLLNPKKIVIFKSMTSGYTVFVLIIT